MQINIQQQHANTSHVGWLCKLLSFMIESCHHSQDRQCRCRVHHDAQENNE